MTTNLKKTIELSQKELSDIKTRVERVSALVKRSATVWLDVAKEFTDAKAKLKQHAYEKFVNDTGFTKAVADKLLSVGKCKRLYAEELQQVVEQTDGWSTLYELSKLERDKKLDQVIDHVRQNPSMNVTRSVVHSIATGNSPTARDLVLVRIVVPKSAFEQMGSADKSTVINALHSCRATLQERAPSCVEFVPVEKSVALALGGNSPQPTPPTRPSSPAAAHVQAQVRDEAIRQQAPTRLPETQRQLLLTTRFQFAELRRIERGEAKKLPYDPNDTASIQHPEHPFSLDAGWTFERFQSHLVEGNILLESDGIPDRTNYAKAWTADLGAIAASGKPAEKRASKKALADIVAGEKRAIARGNRSKAGHAREVSQQLGIAV